ncbi:MAG: hypothetical protein IJJ82_05945 [Clostridia bacterium]|nr:hypothetical protein [Clostridia bacterium]
MSKIIKKDMEKQNNNVAVKSGYYFFIFGKDEIPSTLEKSNMKVKFNDIIYNLYKGTSLEDERKIDEMFGDRLGYYIDDYLVKDCNYEEQEEME